MENLKNKTSLKRFASREFLQGLISVLFFGILIYVGTQLVGIENVKEKIAAAGIFGPILFILLKSSTIIISPLGGNPIYLTAEPLFGFVNGFIYLFIGDMIGYITVFYISQIFGRKIMRNLLSDKQYQYIDSILHKVGTWQGLTLVRIVFFGFADAISYGAGLTPIPFRHYVLVTLPIVIIHIVFLLLVGSILITSKHSYIAVITVFATLPFVFLLLRYVLKRNR